MSKISVIGAGNVGATAVYYIAERNLGNIVMVDIVEGIPQSKGLDFLHSSPLRQYSVQIFGTNNLKEIEGSDIVVFTAGIARKPGMDRMDLLKTNAKIAQTTAHAVSRYAPDAVVVAVTNPLDVIAMVLMRETGFDRRRIVGMAGVLDSTRFRYFIAEKLGVWPGDVQAMVLGGHGDSMVPLTRYTSAGGFAVTELLDAETIGALVERTRKGGAEVIRYLKTGSAYYGPAASVAKMVESVVRNERRLIPASVYLEGEYGYTGIFLGVPIILGCGGVEKIIELELSDTEKTALDRSAKSVQDGMRMIDSLYESGEL
jgi:malate dehydrogenase